MSKQTTRQTTIALPDAQSTEALGGKLAAGLPPGNRMGGLIFLRGELGAGKTTLARGLLRALGHTGAVKSPTYTLIEPYDLVHRRVLHIDLYRLADPQELDYLGLRDELDGALLLVEWPERAADSLGKPDIDIHLSYHPPGRLAIIDAAAGFNAANP